VNEQLENAKSKEDVDNKNLIVIVGGKEQSFPSLRVVETTNK
jgi:hypothetical protein